MSVKLSEEQVQKIRILRKRMEACFSAEIMEWFDIMYKSLGIDEGSSLDAYIVYPSNIDNRKITCACGNPNCKIGINFDSAPDGKEYMLLTDKFGNEHTMRLSSENINEIMASIIDTNPK